jgi:hypothetical protein
VGWLLDPPVLLGSGCVEKRADGGSWSIGCVLAPGCGSSLKRLLCKGFRLTSVSPYD